MQSHPEHNDDPPPPSRKGRTLIGIGVVAALVIIVALHLAGFEEPNGEGEVVINSD